MASQRPLQQEHWSDREEKWQKHVVVALWIIVACVALVGGFLAIGESHGLFNSADSATSTTAWPSSWP
jgi:hypothetical protein